MRSFSLKFLFSVSLLLTTFSTTFSQDTIVKFSKGVIQAKITEVTPNEVKYKKFDFQDGPFYVLNKSEIKMIKYSNGMKEIFDSLNTQKQLISMAAHIDTIGKYRHLYIYKGDLYKPREMNTFLMTNFNNNPEIASFARISKRSNTISKITGVSTLTFSGCAIVSCGVAFVSGLSSTYQGATNLENSLYALAISSACSVAFLIPHEIFKPRSQKYNKKAVRLYNQSFY